MRSTAAWFALVVLTCVGLSRAATAQIVLPAIPLQLDGESRPTQVPPYASLLNTQCDASGKLYVRYGAVPNGPFLPSIAKIDFDGDTRTIALNGLPQTSSEETHPFLFVPADDGSLHEILRAGNAGNDDSTHIDYVRFDPDGAFRSRADFGKDFIPSILLPLPNGNFFAIGVVLLPHQDGVAESALSGIFGPDAKLRLHLRKDPSVRGDSAAKKPAQAETNLEQLQGVTARLADDSNIYVLLADEHAKVMVISQSGRIQRELTLREPFDAGITKDMWVSGNRLLIAYEGEADDPRDSNVYVLYDTQSGAVVRVYRPDFDGTPVCFEKGQTLTVLVHQPASGVVGIATAELQ